MLFIDKYKICRVTSVGYEERALVKRDGQGISWWSHKRIQSARSTCVYQERGKSYQLIG